MSARELPVLHPPEVVVCCDPLAQQVLGEDTAALLSRRFAALANPARLRLLSLLATAAGGAVCACDLVEPLGKSQPTVSHHLRVLSEAGLVFSERRGRNIWYAAIPAALEALRAALPTGPPADPVDRVGDEPAQAAADPSWAKTVGAARLHRGCG